MSFQFRYPTGAPLVLAAPKDQQDGCVVTSLTSLTGAVHVPAEGRAVVLTASRKDRLLPAEFAAPASSRKGVRKKVSF